jgi:hypothetical protein
MEDLKEEWRLEKEKMEEEWGEKERVWKRE